jgi:hypothetical protein
METPSVVIQREGIRGLPGANGEGATYEHVQDTSASEWVVNHNLGVYPTAVAVFLTSGQEIEADVVHMSTNQLRVFFVAPQSGFVRISP